MCRLLWCLVGGGDDRRLLIHGGHVYFTYISLWVGFATMPALRSNRPPIWIPIAIAGVRGTGAFLIQWHKKQLGLRPAS